MMTSFAAKITVPQQVLFRDLAGEAVLLNLESGRYYGLNEVGTRMWTLLVQHGRIEPAFQTLLAEYDVPEDRLQNELLGFVEELTSRQLLSLS